MYAVLFDLDDTLYPEISYVKSGLSAIARYLTPDISAQAKLERRLLDLFASSPDGVFDRFCETYAHLSGGENRSEAVSLLLDVYRKHVPDIQLYDSYHGYSWS